MNFVVDPYVSVGPLNWDMTPLEVSRILGPPSRSRENRSGNVVQLRVEWMMSCIYDQSTGLLVEIGFSKKEGMVFFDAVDLVGADSDSVLQALHRHDPAAVEDNGSQGFTSLGISLTGYRPEDNEVKAVTAFARGRWDGVVDTMKRLTLS